MYSLIHALKQSEISIWLERDELKLACDPNTVDQQLIEQVRSNKPQLVALLADNQVFSKQAFCERQLFRLPCNRKQATSCLSYAQQSMLFVERLVEQNDAYHIPFLAQLGAQVDSDRLLAAINDLAQRHRILKTCYPMDEQGVFQPQYVAQPIDFEYVDVDTHTQLEQAIDACSKASFSLASEPPMRCVLLTMQSHRYVLFVWHHIAFDGWSHGVFVSQLVNLYAQNYALKEGEQAGHGLQYEDYAVWQRQSIQSGLLAKQLAYWQAELSGYTPLALPLDRVRPKQLDYRGDKVVFECDAATTAQLRNLAKALNTTVNVVMLSAFYILLYRITGQQDLILGTTSDNRELAQTQDLIGCFVNSVALRVQLPDGHTIGDLVEHVHQQLGTARANQALPFDALVDALKVPRNVALHPLFQVMYNFENLANEYNPNDALFVADTEAQPSLHYCPAKFDLSLNIQSHTEVISGDFVFACALFERNSVARFSDMYQIILHAMLQGRQTAVQALPFLSDAHRATLMSWSQVHAHYDEHMPLHKRFEQQAERFAERQAVVYDDGNGQQQAMSYRCLNQSANAVAHYLLAQHGSLLATHSETKPVSIALMFEPCSDMLVALLAILKTGVAYVPINPSLPDERICFMLEDSGACMVLTTKALASRITPLASTALVLAMDELRAEQCIEPSSDHTPNIASSSDDPAYIIYTSGSTGQPKGVIQPHKNVSRLFSATAEQFAFTEHDVWTLFHAVSFDFSVWEIWGALLHGGKLVVPDKACLTHTAKFIGLCKRHKVTVLNQTPAAFYVLMEQAVTRVADVASLRWVIFGGDKLNMAQLTRWWQAFAVDAPSLVNMYGITETTVHVTVKQLTPQIEGDISPIGRAIGDMSTHVLTSDKQLAPIGTFGELYVGGAGLALGYLNRPTLTAERFIDSLEMMPEVGRVYRTGDIVRWRDNGELEYLGRNDAQVKIRGYRIELGEIEQALCSHPHVEQAIVRVESHAGMDALLAYYVCNNQHMCQRDELQDFLSARLPDYMVPNYYQMLHHIPLTVNGKVDNAALPLVQWQDELDYVAPASAIEKSLCQIWQLLLGLERVGVADNFFALGGNSILAIRLSALCREQLNREVALADLFACQTIEKLAKRLEKSQLLHIPMSGQGKAPLSFAQQRMWFIEQLEEGSSLYHMPYVLRIAADVDVNKLKQSLEHVVASHDALSRVLCLEPLGEVYSEMSALTLDVSEQQVATLTQLQSKIAQDVQRPFDLFAQLPIRGHCYTLQNDNYLLLVMHHIAFDGWSEHLFFSDLSRVYQAIMNGSDMLKHTPRLSYGDYARWQHDYLQAQILLQQQTYWLKQLDGYQTLQIPTDFVRPEKPDYQGDDVVFTLSQGDSQALRKLAKAQKTTLHNVLLSGFYLLLARLSGQTDLIVGSPTDNRHHAQTHDTIGFFGNTLALRQRIDWSLSVGDFIVQVSRTVTQAQTQQELPFEQLVELLQVERDLSRHPLFQVLFTCMPAKAPWPSDWPVALCQPNEQGLLNHAKFDLSLFIQDDQAAIRGTLNFAVSLFNRQSVTRFANYYQCILTDMANASSQPISSVQYLPEHTYRTLTQQWSYHAGSIPTGNSFQSSFEQQVAKTPHAIAVRFGDDSVSYCQLNERVNRLAHYIRRQYQAGEGLMIKPDTLITLYFDRGIEMIVAMLGVLKSGAAYVPMALDTPAQRAQFILQDTQAVMVLCEQQYQTQLSTWIKEAGSTAQLVVTDAIDIDIEGASQNPEPIACQQSLAYVIYTSGTTGQPKGVMIQQGTLTRFSQIMTRVYQNDDNPLNILSMTSYAFDMFCSEYPLALLSGGQLILTTATQIMADLTRWKAHIRLIQQTPSLWKLLMAQIGTSQAFRHIDVSIGGESASGELLDAMQRCFARVFQAYGPTETCVWSSVAQYRGGQERNIGKPLLGEAIYILDDQQQPVPQGVDGEIYISGIGLAKGYLNRVSLNEARFVTNPFCSTSQQTHLQRMYRTGDIGRWNCDGTIEYVGRNDFQVKVKGYRIELGEIEQVVQRLSGCKQVAVLVESSSHQPQHHFIVAYLVMTDKQLNEAQLKVALQQYLPSYMIPEYFKVLEQLPLNSNGKLDRRALPRIEPLISTPKAEPQNAVQNRLLKVWQQVLGKIQIGIHDDFFKVGGHSLNIVQLVAEAQKHGFIFRLKDVYQHRSIASQASLLNEKRGIPVFEGPKAVSESEYLVKASPLLQSWWQTTDKGIAKSCITSGADIVIAGECSHSVLNRCFDALYQQHPILRTRFVDRHDELWLALHAQQRPVVTHFDTREFEHEEQALAELLAKLYDPGFLWQGVALHLRDEPASKIAVIQRPNETQIHVLVDHILCDGISAGVLRRDLEQLYALASEQQTLSLQQYDYHYLDYIRWLQEDYPKTDDATHAQQFWQGLVPSYQTSRLAHDSSYLGTDFGTPITSQFVLARSTSLSIKQYCAQTGLTKSNVLFTLFNHVIAHILQQNRPSTAIVLSGRNLPGTEHLTGNFADIAFLPIPIELGQFQATDFEKVTELVESASIYLSTDHRQYLPLGVSAADPRELSRQPSTPFVFSFDAFNELDEHDLAHIQQGEVLTRTNTGAMNFNWLRVSQCGDDLLITLDMEGQYYHQDTLRHIMKVTDQVFAEAMNAVLEIPKLNQDVSKNNAEFIGV